MRNVILALALTASPAFAHDYWPNGEPVPPWVKKWCCNENDIHRLNPNAVHVRPDGYHIDGLKNVIPAEKAIPSPDGQYWAFFRENPADDEPYIFLFLRANEWSLTR